MAIEQMNGGNKGKGSKKRFNHSRNPTLEAPDRTREITLVAPARTSNRFGWYFMLLTVLRFVLTAALRSTGRFCSNDMVEGLRVKQFYYVISAGVLNYDGRNE